MLDLKAAAEEVDMAPDPGEQRRLEALRSSGLSGLGPGDPALDGLAAVAAALVGCPVGLVTLVGQDSVLFWGREGVDLPEAPRSVVPCDRVVRSGAPLVVPDATLDPRFADNPLVTGSFSLRFYAGLPLRTAEGDVLGSLCVLDTVPHPEGLAPHVVPLLERLVDQVLAQVELRRALRERDGLLEELGLSERRFRRLAEESPDILSRHAPDGTPRYVSPSFSSVLGRRRGPRVGNVHPDDRPAFRAALTAVQAGERRTVTHRTEHADGGYRWLETRLTPVLDGRGRLREIHSTARDVTGRVEAEQARDRARAEAEELQLALRGALEEMSSRQALVDAVLETIDVGIVACDAQGRLTMFNAAMRDFHGMPLDVAVDPSAWVTHYDLFEEDGHTPLAPERVPLARALHEGVLEDEVVVIAPHGLPARTVTNSGRALYGKDGRVVGAVVAATDITELRASERRFRAAFYDSPTPMAHLDADGVVRDVNPALRRFLALPGRRLLGVPLAVHVHPDSREGVAAALLGPGTGPRPAEVVLLRADGQPVWCELATTRSSDGSGGEHVLAQLLDITARKEHERVLESAARRDPLTGLGNRLVLQTQLEAMLDPLGGVGGAVLLLDLDGFKAVNDVHGHEAGDAVLVEIARRLVSTVRPHDVVVRLGGDEFVVLCRADRGGALPDAQDVADRIEAALSVPMTWEGVVLPLGGSVGWALGAPGDQAEDRLDAADRAMYARKRARRAAVA